MIQISLNINADSVNELNKALTDFLKGKFMAKIEVTPEQETKLTAAIKDAAAEAADNKALTQSAKAAEDIINKAEAKAEEKPKKTTAKKEKPADEVPATSDEDFRPATPEDGVPAKFVEGNDETSAKLILADLIKSGKRAAVQKIFKEYGVTKLSEIPADKLEEVVAKARAL